MKATIRLQHAQIFRTTRLLTPWRLASRQKLCAAPLSSGLQARALLTLAIETSCDDTCVAILEKKDKAARLLFNKKVTSDNRAFGGIHPVVATLSHDQSLAQLIQEAVLSLPTPEEESTRGTCHAISILDREGAVGRRQRPDFISVTRGPGMASPLATGLNTAKGLAVAWGIPLVGVHHMQAHALTPRLVSALAEPWPNADNEHSRRAAETPEATPSFPFLTLLVSGGHTLLQQSSNLTSHKILAAALNIAIGDLIDKCARVILPPAATAAASNVMYGAMLERFAFPSAGPGYDYEYTPPARRADEILSFDSGCGWTLEPPMARSRKMAFDFALLNGEVQRIVEKKPDMDDEERRVLARTTMRLAFEHLAGRVVFALADLPGVTQLVVSGGVASNRFLLHILRQFLDVRGFAHVAITAPPPELCTDNAAMIAWAGMEMWQAGWQSSLDILVKNRWSMDPEGPEGGILGLPGWVKRSPAL